jgi:hypothetical protein
MRNAYKTESLKGRDNSKDLSADGRIIFKQILGKQYWEKG